MKFNAFILTLTGLVFVGISIGYVIGYYITGLSNQSYLPYLSVLFMGVGCFMSIYGSLFNKN